jgi:hypothetical protein
LVEDDKTFIQQSETAAALLHNTMRGHKYAVQVVTETPEYGGYSGAEFDQAQAFGRLAKNARSVTVRCDATIAMPMLVPRHFRRRRQRRCAHCKGVQFSFGRELGITHALDRHFSRHYWAGSAVSRLDRRRKN